MTVRIHKHLSSDTIHVLEAAPMVGKGVGIVIRDEQPDRREVAARVLLSLAGRDVLDPEAHKELRAQSIL